jgi:tetratricopeptide (TPR) repeat protein
MLTVNQHGRVEAQLIRASNPSVTNVGCLIVTTRCATALTCLILSGALAPTDASPQSRAQTRAGFALAYDLQFAAAYDIFAEAARADPRDPAPHRAIAAITWIEILFAQGVATFEAFTGEISKGDVRRPPAPPKIVARYRQSIDQAHGLADRQLALGPDADAHYQVGATAALSSLYRATVDGSTLGAFSEARRAVSEMERSRKQDLSKHEAALVLGMSEYTVSTMSWPVRMLARLSGLAGNRDTALVLLREAATPGAETETDALLLEMIVELREGRHHDALQHLQQLRRAHPRNRLLSLNYAVAALAATQPAVADQVLTEWMAAPDWNASPTVLGEAALWFAHRGTARARLHRTAAAITDLQRGLGESPRDWVAGRIHGQLGDVALEAGERDRARREFELALDLSARGGDGLAVKDVRQKLNALKR